MKLHPSLRLVATILLLMVGLRLAAEGFEYTGSMKQARLFHTATLLKDGRVLVTGGIDPAHIPTDPPPLLSALTSVEIYDPATGSWSGGAPLAEPRYGHAATLLANGEVLVTGGRSTYHDAAFYFVGSAYLSTASAEIYDPSRNVWRTVAPMKLEHFLHTATLLPDGRVLIAGGDADYLRWTGSLPFSYANETEFFDPTAESWKPGGPFSTTTGYYMTGRFGHGVILLPDHRLLAVGGRELFPSWGGSASSDFPNTELFQPETSRWKPANAMLWACFRPLLHLLDDGTVLAVGAGGYIDAINRVNIAERYDPAADRWTQAATTTTGRQSASGAGLPDGRFLVAGGLANGEVATDSNSPLTSCEVFSPLTGQWNPTGPMKTGRANGTLTRLQDGRILAAGGSTEPTAELFVPDPRPRLSVRWTGDQPALLLEDTAGQPCVIEYKEGLGSTTWSVLAAYPHPEASLTASNLPTSARFFRARRTD